MKVTKLLLTPLCGMALALFATGTPQTVRADEMKGAEHLLHLQHIKTTAEAEALKPGDTIAMVCSKCKSVIVEQVTTEKGHIKMMTPGEKHECPGCSSEVKTIGVGKGATQEVKHVCEKCGSDSIFCCATKPEGAATKGMEKEKKDK